MDEKMNEAPAACCAAKEKFSFKKLLLPALAAAVFLVLYFSLQSGGAFATLGQLNEKNLGYGLILLVGILASFHCVGMCGGFILAYSVSAKKDEIRKRNFGIHLQYNLGRLISYTIAGGILGGVGSFFGINPVFSNILLLLAGAFMITFGLSLSTGLFKLRLPRFLSGLAKPQTDTGRTRAPFLIGLATIFIPCGPLAAMQLYALSTGSAFEGALSMFIYAFGTIPVLFGFGVFVSSLSSSRIKEFLKISGAIVLILGLLTASRGLVGFGLPSKRATVAPQPANEQKYQTVEMDVTNYGYKPNVIAIEAGVPVRWIIHNKGMTGCTNAIIIYNGKEEIKKNLSKTDTVIDFIPANQPEIKFSCWMKMVWGKFTVRGATSVLPASSDLSSSGTKNCDPSASSCLSPNNKQPSCSGGSCGCGCGTK